MAYSCEQIMLDRDTCGMPADECPYCSRRHYFCSQCFQEHNKIHQPKPPDPAPDRTYASDGIRIERFTDDDAECHSYGKIDRPRTLIHFGHLCQHFVALCDPCWRRFKVMVGGKNVLTR